MNSEMFLFSVVVAIIGMATVFVALTLMSLMMIVLRRIFAVESTNRSVPTPSPLTARSSSVAADTRWVIAAAAAFLAIEGEGGRHSASAWRPPPDESVDPWINQPTI